MHLRVILHVNLATLYIYLWLFGVYFRTC